MSEYNYPISVYLDVKGLNCPLPILKTKMQLNRMKPGEIIEIHATDPLARVDFEAYCARTGHELIETKEINDFIVFLIRCDANPQTI